MRYLNTNWVGVSVLISLLASFPASLSAQVSQAVVKVQHQRFYSNGGILNLSRQLGLPSKHGKAVREIIILYSALFSGKRAQVLVNGQEVNTMELAVGKQKEVKLLLDPAADPNDRLEVRFLMDRGRIEILEVRASMVAAGTAAGLTGGYVLSPGIQEPPELNVPPSVEVQPGGDLVVAEKPFLPRPQYDSGWLSSGNDGWKAFGMQGPYNNDNLNPLEWSIVLTHNLGGNPDNYLVDCQRKHYGKKDHGGSIGGIKHYVKPDMKCYEEGYEVPCPVEHAHYRYGFYCESPDRRTIKLRVLDQRLSGDYRVRIWVYK